MGESTISTFETQFAEADTLTATIQEKLAVVEWETRRLGEIADVFDSLHATPEYSEDGLPIVRVTDVKTGFLQLNNCLKVPERTFDTYTKKYKPRRHDIVVSRVGSYGNFAYVNSGNDFCLGQNTAIISPKINSRYLHYYLLSSLAKAQILLQPQITTSSFEVGNFGSSLVPPAPIGPSENLRWV